MLAIFAGINEGGLDVLYEYCRFLVVGVGSVTWLSHDDLVISYDP